VWLGLGVAAFVALCGLVVGCDGDGGGSKTIAAEDFPAAIVDVVCASAVGCSLEADEGSCRESSDPSTLEDLFAAVDAGTIAYHGDLAGQCLDMIRQLYDDCSATKSAQIQSQAGGPCAGVFEGTVAVGGDCFVDEECQSDDCAFGTDCTEACCLGVCTASTEIRIGSDCSRAAAMCAVGSYCAADTSLCTAQVGAGEACQDSSACENGLPCVGATFDGTPGTCTALAGEGGACDPQTLPSCDRWDTFCDPASSTCVKRHAVGDPCDLEVDDSCVAFAYCDDDTCTAAPGIGGACNAENGPYCAGALDCVDARCLKHRFETCPR
jgi:hypothetical protein